MIPRRILLVPALAFGLLALRPVAGDAPKSGLPAARPQDVGMSAAELGRIRPAMEEFVRAGKIAGVVTLVARRGKVVHLEATGNADVELGRPMKADSLFWIASMTKSLTSTAVMTLVDEGRLSLDEPASKWMPEFKQVTGPAGKPAREITLRDLLSHTAGLPQPPRKPTDGSVPLARYAVDILRAPLNFEPGSAYEYGFGLTVAGRILEIASGKPFDVYLEERVLRPLGMKDTTWHPDEGQRRRLARTYRPGDNGGLVPAFNPFITQDVHVKRSIEPSGGLFSTAADLSRFYQMILNGGELDGKRILSQRAVAEMTRAHTAGGKELAYGLGWQILRPAAGKTPEQTMVGFGHGGAFATHGAIDPGKGLVTVLLVQRTLAPADAVLSTFHGLAAGAVAAGGS